MAEGEEKWVCGASKQQIDWKTSHMIGQAFLFKLS
jgi:hypothetical protein